MVTRPGGRESSRGVVPSEPRIAPVGEDLRARRFRRHADQRQVRPQLLDGARDGGALRGRRVLAPEVRPGAERLVVQLELLETPRDVELHVAVRDQPVRGIELGQRIVEAPLPVKLVTADEVELRLVGDVLTTRARGRIDDTDRDDHVRQLAEGHRSVLMSSMGPAPGRAEADDPWRGRPCRRCSSVGRSRRPDAGTVFTTSWR